MNATRHDLTRNVTKDLKKTVRLLCVTPCPIQMIVFNSFLYKAVAEASPVTILTANFLVPMDRSVRDFLSKQMTTFIKRCSKIFENQDAKQVQKWLFLDFRSWCQDTNNRISQAGLVLVGNPDEYTYITPWHLYKPPPHPQLISRPFPNIFNYGSSYWKYKSKRAGENSRTH